MKEDCSGILQKKGRLSLKLDARTAYSLLCCCVHSHSFVSERATYTAPIVFRLGRFCSQLLRFAIPLDERCLARGRWVAALIRGLFRLARIYNSPCIRCISRDIGDFFSHTALLPPFLGSCFPCGRDER